MKEITTIQIRTSTRRELKKSTANAGETYDQWIARKLAEEKKKVKH